MRWSTQPNGLKFKSSKHRDFVIDSIMSLGAFPELHSSFIDQKKTPSRILFVPNGKEIGWFLSRYERSLDRKWDQPETILEPFEHSLEEKRIGYWISSLEELLQDIKGLASSKADFEAINRHVWAKVRQLVVQSAEDSFRLRLSRYIDNAPLNWFQKISWWVRSRVLEWRWGKGKTLYGSYEKYRTDTLHDPAKTVRIYCGYCGASTVDDWVRPTSVNKLTPVSFSVDKSGQVIVMTSHSSVSVYKKPRVCTQCNEPLLHAYIHKVARAVMIVLL